MLATVLRRLDTRAGFLACVVLLGALAALLRGIRITVPPERVFDEVYSPVFAWKLLHGEPFFDVHPILAEVPHLPGLLLFGDTPLGWRFGPWLWATVFLLGLGSLGLFLTGRYLVGILAALLAAFDISFFVYGRTGLPDMFLLATFVWTFALFFLSCRARRPSVAVFSALGSGLLLGNLAATKWFGVGGLGLVWAWVLLGFLQRWRQKGASPLPLPRIRPWLYPVAFLLIPLLTYLLWTVPLVGIPGRVRAAAGESLFISPCTFGRHPNPEARAPSTWWGRVVHWHCVVWNYHVYLTAEHPYGSPWWSWPVLKHPVLFYLDTAIHPPRQISATGNPVLWWTGFATVWLTLFSLPIRWMRDRGSPQAVGPPAPSPVSSGPGATSGQGSAPEGAESEERSAVSDPRWGSRTAVSGQGGAEGGPPSRGLLIDLWLLLGVLGLWLPWALIQRVTFHYHYFLSFTLSLLLLAIWLVRFLDRPALRPIVLLFLLLALGSFIILYPTATALHAPWTS